MRIAHFTNTYHPVVSGVVQSVKTFRQGLSELGHFVCVFAQHTNDYEDNEPFVFHYPAFELPIHNKFPISLPVSPFVDWVLPSLKLDVIHTHHPFLLGQAGAHQAERFNLPLVFTFHTQYREYSHYVSLSQSLVKEAIDRLLGDYMKQCHHIIVPSATIQQRLAELYGVTSGVTVLPTGVDMAVFAGLASNKTSNTIRQKHGWGNDRIIISAGRLAPEKNWSTLLAAAARVVRELPDVRLVILGEGDERENLEAESQQLGIASRVHLLGNVPHAELAAYFTVADLFAFASITETQGLVTLEAMAAQLPVVAVDASGTSDVIYHEGNGLLTTNEAHSLAGGIQRLFEEESLRTKLRREGHLTAQAYGITQQAKKLVNIYEEAQAAQRVDQHIQVDRQKPLLNGPWYELLGLEKNPFEIRPHL